MASLSPKEARKATHASKGSGPRVRPGINGLLGFQGWLGILPSAHTLKVANIVASRKEGVKEVWPRTSRILP